MANEWITQVKVRGLAGAVGVALDALEPLGPLGAQLLWVAQPVLGVFGGESARNAANEIAEALETPEGIAHIREQLKHD